MKQQPLKIVVSGPESTGKTELARHLCGILRVEYIPEYARSYVESLNRPYAYEDVEHIAGEQVRELQEATERGSGIIVLDTYLVITKVWFMEVYHRVPAWIDLQLKESGIDLFLLCYYDIEWVKDPVRENPGPRRQYLYQRYLEEIELLGIRCEEIRGTGPRRLENAIRAVLRQFPQLENRTI